MDIDTRDPYDRRVVATLSAAGLGSPPDMAKIPEIDRAAAVGVIQYLLHTACTAQNTRNHILGRGFFKEMPRVWLVERIFHIAERTLNLYDDWEFRRLLELYDELDQELLLKLVEVGHLSSNPDIQEAAQDFDPRRPR